MKKIVIEPIVASEGKVFRLKHNNFILGAEFYPGNVWINDVETPFSMDLVEEVDIIAEAEENTTVDETIVDSTNTEEETVPQEETPVS